MKFFLNKCLLFLFLAVHFSALLEGKVLIMTHCFNKPEFIEWQARLFDKFLIDDYEFVVFNDAPNDYLFNQTEKICRQLNLKCIPVPQEIHSIRNGPSEACSDTIQYMMNTMGFDFPGIAVIIDSDMFLIREFSIEETMKDFDICAYPQVRYGIHEEINYLLPNLMFFRNENLPDKYHLCFDLGLIDGVATDSAGHTYYYLKRHPEVRWLQTNLFYNLEVDSSPVSRELIDEYMRYPLVWQLLTEKKFDYEFYIDFAFFHFRAGSNWNNMDRKALTEKTNMARLALESLLNEEG